MRGMVIRGSRNIFTVRPETGGEIECRIKGKILKGVEGYCNPLAPGDWVTLEEESSCPRRGFILGLEERRNSFSRRNQRGIDSRRSRTSQILAANVDLVLCVTSPASPPFRPRFLDRLLLQADIAGIPGVILCNKWDLFDGDPDIEERLEDFSRIGYKVLRVSAKTGAGMEALEALLENRFSVLVGQSGVGKSSLVNVLIPEAFMRVGNLNEKYNRGNHTTSMSVTMEGRRHSRIIDTPGLRQFVPDGVTPDDLILYMREFGSLAGKCSFGFSCSHRTEPGCKILEAVTAGVIHEDRYESFLRIRDELLENPYDD
ncbi:MAG: ribosome small subunit-dependent GTPase A [Spirochaetaceae bacterium]|nr:ribosome small subunit-dependent GTPase A [Spirochaetaceae bacterium]